MDPGYPGLPPNRKHQIQGRTAVPFISRLVAYDDFRTLAQTFHSDSSHLITEYSCLWNPVKSWKWVCMMYDVCIRVGTWYPDTHFLEQHVSRHSYGQLWPAAASEVLLRHGAMASKGLVGWQDVDLSPEGQAEVPYVATWAVPTLLVLWNHFNYGCLRNLGIRWNFQASKSPNLFYPFQFSSFLQISAVLWWNQLGEAVACGKLLKEKGFAKFDVVFTSGTQGPLQGPSPGSLSQGCSLVMCIWHVLTYRFLGSKENNEDICICKDDGHRRCQNVVVSETPWIGLDTFCVSYLFLLFCYSCILYPCKFLSFLVCDFHSALSSDVRSLLGWTAQWQVAREGISLESLEVGRSRLNTSSS